MLGAVCRRVASLNKFWGVTTTNSLSLSMQPSDDTNHFNTPSCLKRTFSYWKVYMMRLTLFPPSPLLSAVMLTSVSTDGFTSSKMSSTHLKPFLQLVFWTRSKTRRWHILYILDSEWSIAKYIGGTLVYFIVSVWRRCNMTAVWCTFQRAFCQSESHEPLCHLLNVLFLFFFSFGCSVCETTDFVRRKSSISDLTCTWLLTDVYIKIYWADLY